ncbi:MAG TPA: glycine cleavage system aminomethyltransferase GcvT [Propionibacteriaceae bacterium]|nr:glycine cleavage system aminomethyltransferase GcvT [Propionibacteriaceae bacterium]
MSSQPQQSVLHPRHVELGAKFAEFGGWLMPLEYAGGGVLAEHAAVRSGVGVFDVSHLGTLIVRGPGAVDALNAVLTNDLHRIGPGQAQYSLLCADDGGVVDDLICYVRADDDVLVIPNAGNAGTVAAVLAGAVGDAVEVTNVHRDYAIIAVQGPASDEVLTAVGLPVGMDYMAFEPVSRDGVPLTVCRTGYTGERGYELVVPAEGALAVWDAVLDAGSRFGMLPCGLGARDTLRTEMGYSLHGHEISPEINPVEAGLGWAIGWSKPSFHGSEALRRIRSEGPARRARGLLALGRGIPRPGMSVVDADGAEVGVVTSGTFSPTLRQGVALALVRPDIAVGDEVGVRVRNRVEPFRVVKPPFVTPGVREG